MSLWNKNKFVVLYSKRLDRYIAQQSDSFKIFLTPDLNKAKKFNYDNEALSWKFFHMKNYKVYGNPQVITIDLKKEKAKNERRAKKG